MNLNKKSMEEMITDLFRALEEGNWDYLIRMEHQVYKLNNVTLFFNPEDIL